MNISKLSTNPDYSQKELDSIADAAVNWPFFIHPFRDSRPDLVKRAFVEQIIETPLHSSDNKSGLEVILTNSDHGAIVAGFKTLNWDSEFFGFEIGRIEFFMHPFRGKLSYKIIEECSAVLKELISSARARGIKQLTATADPSDAVSITTLEECGFRLKDTILYHFFDTDRLPFATETGLTRYSLQSDLTSIEDLTFRCFSDRQYNFNRFSNDPQFPDAKIAEMYQIWGSKSVSGEKADITVVREIEGHVAGYLTGILPTEKQIAQGLDFGDMGIGAVNPDFHKLGVFNSVHRDLLIWFKQQGIRFAQTRTALSTAAVNKSCTKNGSFIACSPHTFHANLSKAY